MEGAVSMLSVVAQGDPEPPAFHIQLHCTNFPVFCVLLVGCQLTELRAGEKCCLRAARALFSADFPLPFSRSWFCAPNLSLTFSVLAQFSACVPDGCLPKRQRKHSPLCMAPVNVCELGGGLWCAKVALGSSPSHLSYYLRG